MEPKALSIEAVAFLSGLSANNIRRAVASGDLPSIKKGRRRLVLADDLDRWIGKSDVQARKPEAVNAV